MPHTEGGFTHVCAGKAQTPLGDGRLGFRGGGGDLLFACDRLLVGSLSVGRGGDLVGGLACGLARGGLLNGLLGRIVGRRGIGWIALLGGEVTVVWSLVGLLRLGGNTSRRATVPHGMRGEGVRPLPKEQTHRYRHGEDPDAHRQQSAPSGFEGEGREEILQP